MFRIRACLIWMEPHWMICFVILIINIFLLSFLLIQLSTTFNTILNLPLFWNWRHIGVLCLISGVWCVSANGHRVVSSGQCCQSSSVTIGLWVRSSQVGDGGAVQSLLLWAVSLGLSSLRVLGKAGGYHFHRGSSMLCPLSHMLTMNGVFSEFWGFLAV